MANGVERLSGISQVFYQWIKDKPRAEIDRDKDKVIEADEVLRFVFTHYQEYQDKVQKYLTTRGLDPNALQADGKPKGPTGQDAVKILSGPVDQKGSLLQLAQEKKINPRSLEDAENFFYLATRYTRFGLLGAEDQKKVLDALGLGGDVQKKYQDLVKNFAKKSNQSAPKQMAREAFQQGLEHEAKGNARQATQLFRLAIELNPGHKPAHLKLAEYHFREHQRNPQDSQNLAKARAHWKNAIGGKWPPYGLKELVDFSRKLNPKQDPWVAVGEVLVKAGKHGQASQLFHLAANDALSKGDGAAQLGYLEKANLADQIAIPYKISIPENNKELHRLLKSIQVQGIPLGFIDVYSLKAGFTADRVITGEELMKYVTGRIDDPRIQRALQESRLTPTNWWGKGGKLKPEKLRLIQQKGIGEVLGEYHLQKAKTGKNQARHLQAAANYKPLTEASQYRALGDYYWKRKDARLASFNYQAALQLDPENKELTRLLSEANYADTILSRPFAFQHFSDVEKNLEEKFKKFNSFLEKGEFGRAEKLLVSLEADYDAYSHYGNLLLQEPEGFTAKNQLWTATLRFAKAEIARSHAPRKDEEKAQVKSDYEGAIANLDVYLVKNPKDTAAHLMKARAQLGTEDYQAAVFTYGAALANTADPVQRQEVLLEFKLYQQNLVDLLGQTSGMRQIAMEAEVIDVDYVKGLIDREIRITQGLREIAGGGPKTKDLYDPDPQIQRRQRLDEYLAYDKYLGEIQKLKAVYDQLQGENAVVVQLNTMAEQGYLKDLGNYAELTPFVQLGEAGGKPVLQFTQAYQELPYNKKLELLQVVAAVGQLGQMKLTHADPNTPVLQKEYFGWKIDQAEGRIEKARIGMMDFKAHVLAELAKDPDFLKKNPEIDLFYQECRETLRKYTMEGIAKLENYNQMLLGQRLGKFEMNMYDEQDARLNGEFLMLLKHFVEAGKADTLEEAVAFMQSESQRMKEEYARNPVIPKTWTMPVHHANAHYPDDHSRMVETANAYYDAWKKDPNATPPENFPTYRLEGGTLTTQNAGLTAYMVRVVIGREGGKIRTHDNTYTFPPSDQETVVIYFTNQGRIETPPGVKPERGKGYGYYGYGGYSNPTLLSAYNQGHPWAFDDYVGKYGQWTAIDVRDSDFKSLFMMESRGELEKMADPANRRERLLEKGKGLRHRTGSYEIAGDIFLELMQEPLKAAIATIPDDEKKAMWEDIEKQRPEVEKEVKKQLEAFKKDKPATYDKRFPEGEPSKEEFNAMVLEGMKGRLAAKLMKRALPIIEQWRFSNTFGLSKEKNPLSDDPIAQEAWSIYEDMKDPLDKFWNLSDDSWDAIVDEVVITAVTLPLTMGVGMGVRAVVGGTTLVRGLAARGGIRWLAAETIVFVSGAAAESFAMSAFHGDISWDSFKINMLMTAAFHVGGKGWARLANKMGVGEHAISLAVREGRSAIGLRVLNTTGMLATQTTLSVAFEYAQEYATGHHSGLNILDRFAAHGARQVGFHYGSGAFRKMTGGVFHEAEARGDISRRMAREEYRRLIQEGVPEDQAYRDALKHSKENVANVWEGPSAAELDQKHRVHMAGRDIDQLIKRMGIDPESPRGNTLKQVLQFSAAHGEDIPKLAEKIAAEKPKSLDEFVRKVLRMDPNSPSGKSVRESLALVLAGEKGNEVLAKEFPGLASMAKDMEVAVDHYLEGQGLSRDHPLYAPARKALLETALRAGRTPDEWTLITKEGEKLPALIDSWFGEGFSKTAAGKQLQNQMIQWVMAHSSNAQEISDNFKGIALHADTMKAHATQAVDAFLGPQAGNVLGSSTPLGRRLMATLVGEALAKGDNPAKVVTFLKGIQADTPALVAEIQKSEKAFFGDREVGVETRQAFQVSLFNFAIRAGKDPLKDLTQKSLSQWKPQLEAIAEDILGPAVPGQKNRDALKGEVMDRTLISVLGSAADTDQVNTFLASAKEAAPSLAKELQAESLKLLGDASQGKAVQQGLVAELSLEILLSSPNPAQSKGQTKVYEKYLLATGELADALNYRGAETRLAIWNWVRRSGLSLEQIGNLKGKVASGEIALVIKDGNVQLISLEKKPAVVRPDEAATAPPSTASTAQAARGRDRPTSAVPLEPMPVATSPEFALMVDALLPYTSGDREAVKNWVLGNVKDQGHYRQILVDLVGNKNILIVHEGKAYLDTPGEVKKRNQAASRILPKLAKKFGVSKEKWAAAEEAFLQRAERDPTFEVVKAEAEFTQILNTLDPILNTVPNADVATIRGGLFRQVLEGRISLPEAQSLANRVKMGTVRLAPATEGQSPYNFQVIPAFHGTIWLPNAAILLGETSAAVLATDTGRPVQGISVGGEALELKILSPTGPNGPIFDVSRFDSAGEVFVQRKGYDQARQEIDQVRQEILLEKAEIQKLPDNSPDKAPRKVAVLEREKALQTKIEATNKLIVPVNPKGPGRQATTLEAGDALVVNGEKVVLKSPLEAATEYETRQNIIRKGEEIRQEKAEIEKLPENSTERKERQEALAQKQKALDALRADPNDPKFMARTVDGTPLTEVAPHFVERIADPIFQAKGPVDRVALRDRMVKELEAQGILLSTDNLKAVDSIIDVAILARDYGIIDKPGGITSGQFNQLVADLFTRGAVRVGGVEFTHVPKVVEGTLRLFESATGRIPTTADRADAFIAALFHDAGKYDFNIRTRNGFTISANAEINGKRVNHTGKDIVVPPGKSLNEVLIEMGVDVKNPAEVKKHLELPFPGMVAVLVHHDALTVRTEIKGLVDRGILDPIRGQRIWEAIQYHGYVSSWIVKNSLGGIGIRSHVFAGEFEPRLQPYLDAYQRVSQTLNSGERVSLEVVRNWVDPKHPDYQPEFARDVQTMREAFDGLPDLAKALMIGDHFGQSDVGKYMDILQGKHSNVHDLLYGQSMTDSVMGVLQTHPIEQFFLSPTAAMMGRGEFARAEAWINAGMDTPGLKRFERPSLAKAILDHPDLGKTYRAWLKENPKGKLRDWLKTVEIKKADGSFTGDYLAIKKLVDENFTQHVRGKEAPAPERKYVELPKGKKASQAPAMEAGPKRPQGDVWTVLERSVDPATGEVRLRARPKKDGDPNQPVQGIFEGDIRWLFRRYPEMAERLGIQFHEDGSVSYPDVAGLNKRLEKEGANIRFYEPKKEDIDPATGDVKREVYLRHLAEDIPSFPISGAGKHHFHDMAVHGMGLILMPKEISLRIRETARVLLELKAEGPFHYVDGGKMTPLAKALDEQINRFLEVVDERSFSLQNQVTYVRSRQEDGFSVDLQNNLTAFWTVVDPHIWVQNLRTSIKYDNSPAADRAHSLMDQHQAGLTSQPAYGPDGRPSTLGPGGKSPGEVLAVGVQDRLGTFQGRTAVEKSQDAQGEGRAEFNKALSVRQERGNLDLDFLNFVSERAQQYRDMAAEAEKAGRTETAQQYRDMGEGFLAGAREFKGEWVREFDKKNNFNKLPREVRIKLTSLMKTLGILPGTPNADRVGAALLLATEGPIDPAKMTGAGLQAWADAHPNLKQNLHLLSQLSGRDHPQDLVALADWAIRNGETFDSLKLLADRLLDGKAEIKIVKGEVRVVEVAADQVDLQRQKVWGRVQEIPEGDVVVMKTEEEVTQAGRRGGARTPAPGSTSPTPTAPEPLIGATDLAGFLTSQTLSGWLGGRRLELGDLSQVLFHVTAPKSETKELEGKPYQEMTVSVKAPGPVYGNELANNTAAWFRSQGMGIKIEPMGVRGRDPTGVRVTGIDLAGNTTVVTIHFKGSKERPSLKEMDSYRQHIEEGYLADMQRTVGAKENTAEYDLAFHGLSAFTLFKNSLEKAHALGKDLNDGKFGRGDPRYLEYLRAVESLPIYQAALEKYRSRVLETPTEEVAQAARGSVAESSTALPGLRGPVDSALVREFLDDQARHEYGQSSGELGGRVYGVDPQDPLNFRPDAKGRTEIGGGITAPGPAHAEHLVDRFKDKLASRNFTWSEPQVLPTGRKPGEMMLWVTGQAPLGNGSTQVVSLRIYYPKSPKTPDPKAAADRVQIYENTFAPRVEATLKKGESDPAFRDTPDYQEAAQAKSAYERLKDALQELSGMASKDPQRARLLEQIAIYEKGLENFSDIHAFHAQHLVEGYGLAAGLNATEGRELSQRIAQRFKDGHSDFSKVEAILGEVAPALRGADPQVTRDIFGMILEGKLDGTKARELSSRVWNGEITLGPAKPGASLPYEEIPVDRANRADTRAEVRQEMVDHLVQTGGLKDLPAGTRTKLQEILQLLGIQPGTLGADRVMAALAIEASPGGNIKNLRADRLERFATSGKEFKEWINALAQVHNIKHPRDLLALTEGMILRGEDVGSLKQIFHWVLKGELAVSVVKGELSLDIVSPKNRAQQRERVLARIPEVEPQTRREILKERMVALGSKAWEFISRIRIRPGLGSFPLPGEIHLAPTMSRVGDILGLRGRRILEGIIPQGKTSLKLSIKGEDFKDVASLIAKARTPTGDVPDYLILHVEGKDGHHFMVVDTPQNLKNEATLNSLDFGNNTSTNQFYLGFKVETGRDGSTRIVVDQLVHPWSDHGAKIQEAAFQYNQAKAKVDKTAKDDPQYQALHDEMIQYRDQLDAYRNEYEKADWLVQGFLNKLALQYPGATIVSHPNDPILLHNLAKGMIPEQSALPIGKDLLEALHQWQEIDPAQFQELSALKQQGQEKEFQRRFFEIMESRLRAQHDQGSYTDSRYAVEYLWTLLSDAKRDFSQSPNPRLRAHADLFDQTFGGKAELESTLRPNPWEEKDLDGARMVVLRETKVSFNPIQKVELVPYRGDFRSEYGPIEGLTAKPQTLADAQRGLEGLKDVLLNAEVGPLQLSADGLKAETKIRYQYQGEIYELPIYFEFPTPQRLAQAGGAPALEAAPYADFQVSQAEAPRDPVAERRLAYAEGLVSYYLSQSHLHPEKGGAYLAAEGYAQDLAAAIANGEPIPPPRANVEGFQFQAHILDKQGRRTGQGGDLFLFAGQKFGGMEEPWVATEVSGGKLTLRNAAGETVHMEIQLKFQGQVEPGDTFYYRRKGKVPRGKGQPRPPAPPVQQGDLQAAATGGLRTEQSRTSGPTAVPASPKQAQSRVHPVIVTQVGNEAIKPGDPRAQARLSFKPQNPAETWVVLRVAPDEKSVLLGRLDPMDSDRVIEKRTIQESEGHPFPAEVLLMGSEVGLNFSQPKPKDSPLSLPEALTRLKNSEGLSEGEGIRLIQDIVQAKGAGAEPRAKIEALTVLAGRPDYHAKDLVRIIRAIEGIGKDPALGKKDPNLKKFAGEKVDEVGKIIKERASAEPGLLSRLPGKGVVGTVAGALLLFSSVDAHAAVSTASEAFSRTSGETGSTVLGVIAGAAAFLTVVSGRGRAAEPPPPPPPRGVVPRPGYDFPIDTQGKPYRFITKNPKPGDVKVLAVDYDPIPDHPHLIALTFQNEAGAETTVMMSRRAAQDLQILDYHEGINYRRDSLYIRRGEMEDLPVSREIRTRKEEANQMLDGVQKDLSHGQPGQAIDWASRHEDWGGIAAASDQGRHYKDHNEDRYVKLAFSDGRTLVVAIDGVGGHKGGEEAAEVARAVLEKAAREGKTLEEALKLADAAVFENNRRLGFVDAEGNVDPKAPGAVAVAVEIIPNGDGTYRGRFLSIGDSEAVVIRLDADDPIIHHTARPTEYQQKMREGQGLSRLPTTEDGRLLRGHTGELRWDRFANIVDTTLGSGANAKLSEMGEPLRNGDLVLSGSDGFIENFASLDIIVEVLVNSGAKTPAEKRNALMTEVLLRQSLARVGRGRELNHETYVEAYRDAFGMDPPRGWKGMYENSRMERVVRGEDGKVYRDWDGHPVKETLEGPFSVDDAGDVVDRNGRKVDHFKRDNVTLIVQEIGVPLKPDVAVPGAQVEEPVAQAARTGGREAVTPRPEPIAAAPPPVTARYNNQEFTFSNISRDPKNPSLLRISPGDTSSLVMSTQREWQKRTADDLPEDVILAVHWNSTAKQFEVNIPETLHGDILIDGNPPDYTKANLPIKSGARTILAANYKAIQIVFPAAP